MDSHPSFGYWLRRRRKALDLTQEALAQQVGCSEVTIRKIEADERRPSRQIAERLAVVLAIAVDERAAFLQAARAELGADRLATPVHNIGMPWERSTAIDATPLPRDAPASAFACSVCGASIPPHQRFCGRCGTAISHVCLVCGHANPIDASFCSSCGAALEGGAPPTPAPREERRWATVLFADLAWFTTLSEQMDPEDVKALVGRCIERMGQEVERFGGSVIHVQGDAVLAVFGAPQAHEDDAERAVRAGIAMRDSLLADASVQLHIGINTGEVLATMYGPLSRRDYTVLGDTVNTADRILKTAPPGSVWVGEGTYRATQQAVQYRQLQPVTVKGKQRPVRVWEAISVAMVPQARWLGTASLVGRDDELALLQALWLRVVREARPQLALVLGEPGIGKSRLCAEFERALPGDALVLHGRCLPYGEVLGYGALALVLKEAAGITADDDAETARARLAGLVAGALGPEGSDADPSEVARHLALLSGLDVEADRWITTPDERSLHMSARQFLEGLARRRSLCVILEDIHWADDALLGLIEFVAGRVHDAPLLIVTQARWDLLEKRPAWGRGVRELVSVPLEPLDERRRHELLLELCHKHGLAEPVTDQVARQAGGNPLFMEELVAMIAEQGSVGAVAIPSAIKPLLAARLDALSPAERSALQLASVFGRVFWAGGVRALDMASDIIAHFDALEQRNFLQSKSRSQIRGEQEYAFKHELIRDVAYDMLPRAERRLLHGKVVDWMEQAVGERVEEYFDLLAHHATQAGYQQRAVDYLVRAAERAHRAAAHREEAALLEQAIALAEGSSQQILLAELRARRGIAFHRIGMWTEARSELEAAIEGFGPEHVDRHVEALVELAMVCHWLLDVPGTRRYATEALARAEQVGRADLAAGAMGALAFADSSDGRLASSLQGYERAFARAGDIRTTLLAPAVEMSGLILYWLGRTEQAIARTRETVQIGRAVNDTMDTIRGLGDLGMALTGGGRYDEALQVFEEARQFGREYGIEPMLARAIAMCGGLHLVVFDFAGAEALAEEARELGRSVNFHQSVASGGIDLLLNFARRQEVVRAEQLVDEVAEAVKMGTGSHGWLWRLRFAQARAELALARGDWEAALRWAYSAIEQASEQGRVKYQVLGLGTRARALAGLGRSHQAIADLRSAVDLARPVGDPALFLCAAAARLAIDGDDLLAAEASLASKGILLALPNDAMRRRFEDAEPVQLLRRLGR
jgi:class 3 adenylate cyclase/transcriptional regulator with XRE-family HTH domain/tetratricopeptide (TPR) repeat protein